ncbi:DUF4283 domain-containing protein [Cephalotus follicularis]|uniref:DUF4283 domain-containing protein n=1 Tax=Cephalotus follicularis TaxID=3775 RepID=A0A1Q3BJ40_CEPFO|nr:DUF4283 domain-containing protein [Cephalotus follicularis]
MPPVNAFDNHVNSSWGLFKPATVGLLDHRTFTIQLQSMDDLTIAWSRVSRTFNGRSFLLLRWSPGSRRQDSPLAAVWLSLPGLPLPLHNPSFLKAFGDSLGRFLCSDETTAKFKYPRAPRICVELDLSAPPPPAFVVAFGEWKIHQRIAFQSRLLYCSHCLLQGHNATSCRNRKGKRPAVASFPVTHSGKQACGGVLLAGTPPLAATTFPCLCHPLHPPHARQVFVEMHQCLILCPFWPFHGLSHSRALPWRRARPTNPPLRRVRPFWPNPPPPLLLLVLSCRMFLYPSACKVLVEMPQRAPLSPIPYLLGLWSPWTHLWSPWWLRVSPFLSPPSAHSPQISLSACTRQPTKAWPIPAPSWAQARPWCLLTLL